MGAIAACFAYGWAVDAASIYANLIEATFDLHRQLLYQALNVPLPQDPDEERRAGKWLTDRLWRGPDLNMADFHAPPKA